MEAAERNEAFALLAAAREAALQERFTVIMATFIDLMIADEKARAGDIDGAIELSRAAVEEEFACGDTIQQAAATATLVRALLSRGGPTDLPEACEAIERVAAVPTEPGFVINQLWLSAMRALEAQARGDEPLTANIETNIVRWRIRLASRAISLGRGR